MNELLSFEEYQEVLIIHEALQVEPIDEGLKDFFGKLKRLVNPMLQAKVTKLVGPANLEKFVDPKNGMLKDIIKNKIHSDMPVEKVINYIMELTKKGIKRNIDSSYFISMLDLMRREFSTEGKQSAAEKSNGPNESLISEADNAKVNTKMLERMRKLIDKLKKTYNSRFEQARTDTLNKIKREKKKALFNKFFIRRKTLADSILQQIEYEITDRAFGKDIAGEYVGDIQKAIKNSIQASKELKIAADAADIEGTEGAAEKAEVDVAKMYKDGQNIKYNGSSDDDYTDYTVVTIKDPDKSVILQRTSDDKKIKVSYDVFLKNVKRKEKTEEEIA